MVGKCIRRTGRNPAIRNYSYGLNHGRFGNQPARRHIGPTRLRHLSQPDLQHQSYAPGTCSAPCRNAGHLIVTKTDAPHLDLPQAILGFAPGRCAKLRSGAARRGFQIAREPSPFRRLAISAIMMIAVRPVPEHVMAGDTSNRRSCDRVVVHEMARNAANYRSLDATPRVDWGSADQACGQCQSEKKLSSAH